MSRARPMLAVSGSLLPWLRRALLVALTALAAWLGVRLVIAIVAPSSLHAPVMVGASTPAQATASRTAYDFSYNPFDAGDAAVVEVDRDLPDDDAPETTLNLELKGQRSGANGSAYIRTPNGDEDNFYIGDAVMPGVTLRGVFPDYVLIEVNGQVQRLTTEDAKTARTASSAAPSQGLQTLRAPDAQTLLSQINLGPAFDADMNRIGLTINSRSAGVDLATYGLRDGDIVTRFAGQSLTSGLPDMGALRRAVSPGRPVQINILRDGQPQTITIGVPS